MSLAATNIQGNHRGVYFEFVGDGVSTQITVSLGHIHTRPSQVGVATVRTNPTTSTHESGKGGFYFPAGTNVAVSSATVANGQLTVTTGAAVGNGTKAYVVFVFNEESARN